MSRGRGGGGRGGGEERREERFQQENRMKENNHLIDKTVSWRRRKSFLKTDTLEQYNVIST